jgi:hypothetical protein
MARPSKLTPEIQEKLERALRAGGHLRTAAAHAGVDPSTLRRWMRRDPKLHQALLSAEADGQLLVIGRVVQGAATNPSAGIKFLQVRYPALFGAHRQGLVGSDPEAIDAEETRGHREPHRRSFVEELSPDYRGELVSLLLAARRGDTPGSWHAARLTDRLETLRESSPPLGVGTGEPGLDSTDRPVDDRGPGTDGGSTDEEATSTG